MATFSPIVCIVDFHHARGPEIETWLGVEDGSDPASENEWPLLPFMALADGAHAATEDFSYFTLRREATAQKPATSLFGIACTRQLDANQLVNRPADVTRSTVQKAVVVIANSPHYFGQLREKLSVVTNAWFAQKDFTDLEILHRFQESLARNFREQDEERDQYFGLSLRELIHEFKHQTLVLLKCCLLQPKMLFFGSHCERLCMMQFSLISLIPGLLRHLQDCADPQLDSYEETLVMPTSLRTSERASLLAYMGLPLQIFGKGSFLWPYMPLQNVEFLVDPNTKSYIVGSTNSLLLQQKDRYCDILINLDERSINISSPSLRSALALSTPDRRWIDFLTQAVNDTWDEANPSRPKTMGYAGSEEFIRLQFEEYILALLSAVKYKQFLEANKDNPNALLTDVEGDPSEEFGSDFIEAWMKTDNFRIFNKFTDSHLFDIVDPKHPCSGGLSIEDVQRRLALQVTELHLDERLQASREALSKNIANGQRKVSSALNNVWADIERMREAQRRKHEEQKAAQAAQAAAAASETPPSPTDKTASSQASTHTAGSRASAYLSSWSAWAAEKRKQGWGNRSASNSTTNTPVSSPPPTGDQKFAFGSPKTSIDSTASSTHERTSAETEREPEVLFDAKDHEAVGVEAK